MSYSFERLKLDKLKKILANKLSTIFIQNGPDTISKEFFYKEPINWNVANSPTTNLMV